MTHREQTENFYIAPKNFVLTDSTFSLAIDPLISALSKS